MLKTIMTEEELMTSQAGFDPGLKVGQQVPVAGHLYEVIACSGYSLSLRLVRSHGAYVEELKDAGGTGEKKTTEFKVEGDIFERFASGYDDDANPSIAYFTVPLKRVLREGRFGQVVLCGELEVFNLNNTAVSLSCR